MTVRIALLDDHLLFREGLRAVIQTDPALDVVGEAADARSAYAIVESAKPDVVVADITLPGINGIAFTRELVRRGDGTRVLVLTMHARADMAGEALDAGARGYALKDELPDTILGAIRLVSRGERYVSPRVRGALDRVGGSGPLGELSTREREVFDLAVNGFSNEKIGRTLCISIKTVQTHRAKINQKLGVHSTGELVRFAALRGLIAE
jgi:DNA-binding NarL/FixJ family response regulator